MSNFIDLLQQVLSLIGGETIELRWLQLIYYFM